MDCIPQPVRAVAAWGGYALFASAVLLGCAGSVLKIDPASELPKEVPKELQSKFEVKDEAALAADRAVEPNGSKKSVASRKGARKAARDRKKGKATLTSGAAELPTGGAFVYPMRRPPKDPVWIGEHQVYEISYLGMTAARVSVDVLPYKVVGTRKVYHVRGNAVSSKFFSLIYRVNDTVETYFDYEGLFSHRFHIVLDESKQTRDALELNDSEKAQTFYWNRWNRSDAPFVETKDFQPAPSFSQDSLSALYYMRFLPLKDGEVSTFPVISEGKVSEAVVTVVRREVLNTPVGTFRTVVVKPETKFQGVAQQKGDSYIWLTDDDRRVIVRMEAKVKIGTVVARLAESQPGSPPEGAPAPAGTTAGTGSLTRMAD